MRKLYLFTLLVVVLVLTGCAGAEFVQVSGVEEARVIKKDVIKILQNTDPRFLDKVLSTMRLPDELFKNIKPNDKIVVQSVERNYISDEDLQFVIYRGLVNKLLERNLTVLDRDENILAVSLAEADSQFRRAWVVYRSKYADSLVYFNKADVFKATKILGYRVLEFGQTLVPVDENKIQRIGVVELEVRLVDANTTQLYYIDQVRNFYYDFISGDDYQIIAGLHYKFSSDALPLVLKNVQYRGFLTPAVEEKAGEQRDSIQITFRRGDRSSNVKIYHKESGRIVANFYIPRFGSPFYVYTLRLVDENNKRLPSGDYVISIDDEAVHVFNLK